MLSGTATPSPTDQLAPADVEHPAVEAQLPCRAAPSRCGGRLLARRSTALMRASSSRGLNGLVTIVVGADLEPDDAVGLFGHGGQQDDRQVAGARADGGRARGRPRPAS